MSTNIDNIIKKIAAAYEKFEDEEGFAKVANIHDLGENAFSLSIPLYVKQAVTEEEIDDRTVQQRYDSWYAMSERMRAYYEHLNVLLGKEADDNE